MITDADGRHWLTLHEIAVALRRSKNRIYQLAREVAEEEHEADRLLQGGYLPFRMVDRQKMVRLRHAHRLQILRESDLVEHFGIELTTLRNALNLHPRKGGCYSLDDIDVLGGRPMRSLEDRVGLPVRTSDINVATDLNGELQAGLRHISMLPPGSLRAWHLNDLIRRASARGVSLGSLVGWLTLA
jgi:hypothetical protein